MNVFAGKTGYIVWPQGDTGVHTCRVYDSLDEAESAARSKADFYHRAHGGGFADRTDEESNRLFTSGWATRGEAVRMLKCLDCEEKTT